MNINITIADKRCTVQGTPSIVCGNSDYTIAFTFDEEWAQATDKTARFSYVRDGERRYHDVKLSAGTVVVPPVYRTRELQVGVYAGELVTTTPARIPCEKSIVCDTCLQEDLEPVLPTPPSAEAVLYVEQNLTAEQKAQARENIGAATVVDILDALPTWQGGSY